MKTASFKCECVDSSCYQRMEVIRDVVGSGSYGTRRGVRFGFGDPEIGCWLTSARSISRLIRILQAELKGRKR